MAEYDFIVVGGGISGLLSTLALAKKGKRVLVLEKSGHLGGVCRSYDVEGYQVDTGPHIITRLEHGPLKELMDEYFTTKPEFVPHGKYYVRMHGKLKPFPWNLTAWMGFDMLPITERMYLIKTLISVSHLFSSDPTLKEKSVQDLLGTGLTQDTKNFLDCMCGFMTGGAGMAETPVARFIDAEKYKTTSNGIFDKIMNVLFKEGAADQTYPVGGIQSITNSIISSIPEHMAEFKTGEEVKKIDPAGKTVSTSEDNYTADTIIYSGYASDLPKLVENLPSEYQAKLGKIQQVQSLTLWLGLKKKLFENQGSEIWVGPPHAWVVPTSNYDPNLAPPGHQLAGFGFLIPWESDVKTQQKNILESVYQSMPGVEENVEMTHFQNLVPEKAAWTVTSEFAQTKTPVENLYLVGTDTERKSMGITRASYSVKNLLNVLKEDGKI
ncbi:MAG TPA: NAD(P)/FAD-dependent oxidoreductase [Candidatus Altiarchaeales archaeon]|nr:NAD(P)/FAD-dependent oxidoreductase [Candidatus Altiarchaeales archaeon]